MDGESDGTQAQGESEQGQQSQPAQQGDQNGSQAERQTEQQVDAPGKDVDYASALKSKDAKIEELQGKIAQAAKTMEATEALNKQIADLKQQIADERTEFALKNAGARSIKAAKALLADHDGDIDALVKAEPWLFAANSTNNGVPQGTTGLEPAGASGGSDDRQFKRWERIAGLTAEETKE